ncbi:phycobilisome rod-core linker polypeptide [Gloeobacter morelensis]|uniref:Phycobilisome rod-core linker polypeptide n=1 Tax=Gloeobacter morelensis MG652769 TaxID=2781736 RepID=A0ABY3PMN5_9CYAN|nr:phycobilisome rod-core linker polypeptide [Gloeobacter morelensis]UFP94890.1 phycobilisome rod-core linker polypeptide [Gloeobacter morelensis MG652769]
MSTVLDDQSKAYAPGSTNGPAAGLEPFVRMSRMIRSGVPEDREEPEELWLSMVRDIFGRGYMDRLSQTRAIDYSAFVRPADQATTDAAAQTKLGITAVAPDQGVELRPNFSEADVITVIRAAYKQLFGNTYILESERVIQAESLLRNGSISVREFIRILAKSDLYKERFFRCTSNNRFIELNLKHLLGRAPYNQGEIAEHLDRYCQSGYDAEIDSYIDSDEYRRVFGENTVPYFRGFKYQVGQSAAAFERMRALYSGDAGSDTDRNQNGQRTELTAGLAAPNQPVRARTDYALTRVDVPGGKGAAGRLAALDESLGNWLDAARDLISQNDYSQKAIVVEPKRVAPYAQYLTPAVEATPDAAAQTKLGITAVAPDQPVELRPNFGETEVQAVIRAAYKQIFGNTYILEADRVVIAESLLRNGSISVREFVRLLAKSDLYKDRFFRTASNNRFIELNFKHFLGRAPYSQAEIGEHFNRYHKSGYDAEIDSYIDSDEYRRVFGENTVPYFRGFKYQVGQAARGFDQMQQLFAGEAGSDTDRGVGAQPAAKLTFPLSRPLGLSSAYFPSSQNGAATSDGLEMFTRMARELTVTPVSTRRTTSPTAPTAPAMPLAGYYNRPAPRATADAAAQTKLGITAVAPAPAVELRPNFGEAELQEVIRAAYRQLFGNTYILEADRVIQAESLLRNRSISVREFVRLLAKSELYKERFFYCTSNNRFIELTFKHLLGRAPYNQSEFVEHLDRYQKSGYDAEIDSYIDSDEYRRVFGENTVPYFRGLKYQTGQTAGVFERTLKLYGGDAGSDTDRNRQGQLRQVDPQELLRSGRGIV